MTTTLGRGLLTVLVALDVPEVVVTELSEVYGESVWWQVVRNARSRAAGAAVDRLLHDGATDDVNVSMVLVGLAEEVPGVREAAILSSSLPDSLRYWMADRLTLSRAEKTALLHGARTWAAEWYLGKRFRLRYGVAAHVLGRGQYASLRSVRTANSVSLRVWSDEYGAGSARGMVDAHGVGNFEYLDQVARRANELLGEGSSEDSLEGWRRLLDLVSAGGSEDIVQLLDATARILAADLG